MGVGAGWAAPVCRFVCSGQSVRRRLRRRRRHKIRKSVSVSVPASRLISTAMTMTTYKNDGIGLEGTEAEFEELLGQAASLTPEEAVSELVDCARYGESDAVRAICDKHGDETTAPEAPFVDSQNASGSTALHMACANGHVHTCRFLLSRGANHLPNSSGNTPLHWAAANGHEEIVKMLLDEPRFKDKIDVLQKNQFGRSALTEGFSSSNTKLVGHLLEHDTAEEERLIGGIKKEDVTNTNEADAALNEDGSVKSSETGSSATVQVVHEFDFLRQEAKMADNGAQKDEESEDKKDMEGSGDGGNTEAENRNTILIRELPIAHADDPFGAKPEEDTTGLGIWAASLVCARWMASEKIASRMEGKSVIELGAGCGIPGLAVAFHSKAKSVLITDLNPLTVKNAEYNIDLNKDRVDSPENWCERVTAATINWDDESTWPKEKVDYVVCSDCIYQASIVPMLQKVIVGLLKPDGCFFYVCPEGGRDGLPEFIKVMSTKGFQLVEKTTAPEQYRQNPLSSGDEEDCFLHFHELASTSYDLFEFRPAQQ